MLSMDPGSHINTWVFKNNQTLEVIQAKITKYQKLFKLNLCSGNKITPNRGHVSQTQNLNNSNEKKLSITIRILHTSRFSLISPRMQCKEALSLVRYIYDIPAAQRKIIDQRVIAGLSKTSHQQ